MKHYKQLLIITISLLFVVSSCTKDFDTLIKDPVALSAKPNGQLSFVELSMSGDRNYQWRANLAYSGGFSQQYSGSWAVTEYGAKYKKNDGYAYALWRRAYPNEIKNIVDVIEETKNNPKTANLNAIAKIVRVMVAHRLTDLYGDIPYSEAGYAFPKEGYTFSEGIVAPVYDKQEDIYTSFFKDLDESFNQLSANGGEVTGDLFYNGDVSKWKKLANTLRLRLGMRISEVKPAEAEKQVKAAFQNGVFQSNDDNCVLDHGDIAFNGETKEFRGNGLSQAFIGNELADHFSSLLIDFLKDHNDPRLPMLATKRISNENWAPVGPTDELYVGVKPGNFRWDHPGGSNAASGIQPYYSKRDAPFLHVSYSETELLLAEAAQRGWVSGSAANYYKKGVEAGIKQLEIYGAPPANQAAIDAYLTANPLVAGTEFEQIGTQLWVTYLFNSIEAYSNQRRTGYPALIPITAPDSETGGVTPKRFYYPDDELQKNEVNYLDALSRIGGVNDWLQPVWWDKN